MLSLPVGFPAKSTTSISVLAPFITNIASGWIATIRFTGNAVKPPPVTPSLLLSPIRSPNGPRNVERSRPIRTPFSQASPRLAVDASRASASIMVRNLMVSSPGRGLRAPRHLGARQVEDLVHIAVSVAAQASDRAQLGGIHAALGEHGIAHVRAEDLADHEHRAAELDLAMQLALEAHRRLGDARPRDLFRGQGREPGELDLVHVL